MLTRSSWRIFNPMRYTGNIYIHILFPPPDWKKLKDQAFSCPRDKRCGVSYVEGTTYDRYNNWPFKYRANYRPSQTPPTSRHYGTKGFRGGFDHSPPSPNMSSGVINPDGICFQSGPTTTFGSNQSENGKYNLISVSFNKISKRFLCVYR